VRAGLRERGRRLFRRQLHIFAAVSPANSFFVAAVANVTQILISFVIELD
jgi:hypothetical protein